MKIFFALLTAIVVTARPAGAQPLGPGLAARSEAALKKIAAWQTGQSREDLCAVEDCIRQSDVDLGLRMAMERRLIEFLESEATVDAKRFACRQLFLIGSAKSVPALAKLLENKELSEMALYALRGIPDPAADTALVEALTRFTGTARLALVNVLGSRAAEAAVEPLTELAAGENLDVARASIVALKNIPTAPAAEAIAKLRSSAAPTLRPAVMDALLGCAERALLKGDAGAAQEIYTACFAPTEAVAIRAAALRGLVRCAGASVVPQLLEILSDEKNPLRLSSAELLAGIKGTPVTRQIADALPKMPASSQVLALHVLGDRGDAAALPMLLAYTAKSPTEVAIAAIEALGALADGGAAADLIKLCASHDAAKAKAAVTSLTHLRGPKVDAQIISALSGAAGEPQKSLIAALIERQAVSAVERLASFAADAAFPAREQAFKALGELGTANDAPIFIKLLVTAKDEPSTSFAESALASLCGRLANVDTVVPAIVAAFDSSSAPTRCAILRVLARTGSPKAQAIVVGALKDSDPAVIDAAVRAVAAWPSPDMAEQALAVAKESSNKTHHALAFRGYIRMAGLVGQTSAARAMPMFQQAMSLAASPEEKKAVLAGLATVPQPQALSAVLGHLEDPAVKNEACVAALKLAGILGKTKPELARETVQKVLASTKDASIKKQAQSVLAKLEPAKK